MCRMFLHQWSLHAYKSPRLWVLMHPHTSQVLAFAANNLDGHFLFVYVTQAWLRVLDLSLISRCIWTNDWERPEYTLITFNTWVHLVMLTLWWKPESWLWPAGVSIQFLHHSLLYIGLTTVHKCVLFLYRMKKPNDGAVLTFSLCADVCDLWWSHCSSPHCI